ncbi:ArsR/SmtB family transcription factor [Paenibacillus rhizoplanae]
MRIWYEHYFRHVEHTLLPLLIEDASEKNAGEQNGHGPADRICFRRDCHRGHSRAKKTIVLLPTVHNRPINTYCFFKNLMLVQYPVDVPSDNEEEPPTVLLRLTQALSDPTRLRLLRFVANEPKTLWEMQSELSLSREMLMHHLLSLRVAGLLRVHLRGEGTERYSIRPDGASELQMFLESYIRI